MFYDLFVFYYFKYDLIIDLFYNDICDSYKNHLFFVPFTFCAISGTFFFFVHLDNTLHTDVMLIRYVTFFVLFLKIILISIKYF